MLDPIVAEKHRVGELMSVKLAVLDSSRRLTKERL
jgi:hypothetical protein